MAVQAGWDAGADAWRHGTIETSGANMVSRYQRNWALYSGEMFSDVMKRSRFRDDTRVYRGTSMVYKHVESVVTFYATTVYQGDLSTDGKPLPDGTYGAIPIDPQVGDETREVELRTALAQVWSGWNWRENMVLRPMYGSALGDLLTELVDARHRGNVYPRIVWPGYVVDVELDHVSNLRAYAVEYTVREVDRAKGRDETYRFRYEITGDDFRYFKDDQPFTDRRPGGHGDAVQPNRYGFVPAIWDRHRRAAPNDVRGLSATAGTWQALAHLNGHLSHGMDYQAKGFQMPILVSGSPLARAGQRRIDLSLPPRMTTEPDRIAEEQDYLPVSEGAELLQAKHDIGGMLDIVREIKTGIIEENPEGSFYRKLGEMTTLTGPGAERALGDAIGRCRLARSGYDTQSIKLFQMALSMLGMRANEQAAGTGWETLTPSQQVFLPFTEGAYKAGQMDFGISDRPVVPATAQERLALIEQKERIMTRQGLIEAGYSDDPGPDGEPSEVDRLLQERRDAFAGDYRSVDGRGDEEVE